MKKFVFTLLVIIAAFLLQTTVFPAISPSGIVPNLLLVLVCSFGLLRGRRSGMTIGFVCGLILDIFFGFYLGLYAMILLITGYICGCFQNRFFADDFKLPMFVIAVGDLAYNFIIYFLMFFFRNRENLDYYCMNIILPELIFTMLLAIFIYLFLLRIEQELQKETEGDQGH